MFLPLHPVLVIENLSWHPVCNNYPGETN